MLSVEDQNLLGLTPRTQPVRRPSSVSQVLRSMSEEIPVQPLPSEKGGTNYRILVASNRSLRERAYALAYRVYRNSGYVQESEPGRCVSPYDVASNTLTLLAQDDVGRDLATISLVFDSPLGLPCDELYATEIAALRAQQRRLVEVTRLAIDDARATSRYQSLLLSMINHVFIYGVRVRASTDTVIEVNPRHVNYYRRFLRFGVLGPERPCSRVNGSPAILLHLEASVYESEVRRVGGTAGKGGPGGKALDRTLYPHFHSPQDEIAIANDLARNYMPMTDAEAEYFGLEPSRALQYADRCE